MHHNQHIADLGPVIRKHGVRFVILCPGSRNAPLIQLFTSSPEFHCYSIVDERSAGYVALGMATYLKEPVVVVTTSGTAVMNLFPAVGEAFQQHIPLVLLTADRPRESILQFNNQATDQYAPYFNHTRGFFEFPSEVRTESELQDALRAVDQLLNVAAGAESGPVHINIPLAEPLYEKLPQRVLASFPSQESPIPVEELVLNMDVEMVGKKILVMAGMGVQKKEILEILSKLSGDLQLAVVAENIANLPSEQFLPYPELILGGASDTELEKLAPDVVIAFGGQVVSKRLKLFIQSLNRVEVIQLEGAPLPFLNELFGCVGKEIKQSKNSYLETWKFIESREVNRAGNYINDAPFSNLTAIHKALSTVPAGTVVHLGNSATIRYTQLMPRRTDLTFYSNRGTSGIDGSVSTAVGAAMVSNDLHLLLVGDLSFVYDSNALWNNCFPENLKIIILNDGGGGIFRLLKGPDSMEFFEEFSVTHHPVSLELLSQSFGKGFQRVQQEDELEDKLEALFLPGSSISILEVDTTQRENSRIFKQFFNRNQ